VFTPLSKLLHRLVSRVIQYTKVDRLRYEVKGKKNRQKGGIKFPKKARKVPKMDKKGNLFNKLFFIQKSIQIIHTIEKLKYLETRYFSIFLGNKFCCLSDKIVL
jgi:hypothetical protein